MQYKKFLITSALPYANGPIHFGHLAGAYLPADVYYRHRKLQGKKALFICGSDEHGVAIMLNAKKANQSYEEYVDHWHKEHSDVFNLYGIRFSFFGRTSSSYHKEETINWFNEINSKGYIGSNDCQQLFCNDCKNHLPDRFVEGECYKCSYEQARGDECPNCGELIDSIKLKNPICKICESQNIKEVTVMQYYLLLSKFHKEYRDWFKNKKDVWRKTVFPYVDSLTKEKLHDRAISRDLDWGIDVPIEGAKGKKLYVWFDAPIGYVSNTKKYFEQEGIDDDYIADWWKNPEVEISNFIGKDNIIFHSIIFPSMSMIAGFVNPVHNVSANQFLNLEGKQFSKSTGHYVDAIKAVNVFGQDSLRYYLLSILPESMDSSFSWEQMQAKINNELANNIGNFLNRCLKFCKKNFDNGLDKKYFQSFASSKEGEELEQDISELHQFLENYQMKKGIEKLMNVGQKANNFFSDSAPWAQIKKDRDLAEKTIAYSCVYALCLGIYMEPFLPNLSSQILSFFSNFLTEDYKMRLYKREFAVLNEIFSNGFKMENDIEALVPKIEDSIIKDEMEKLKN